MTTYIKSNVVTPSLPLHFIPFNNNFRELRIVPDDPQNGPYDLFVGNNEVEVDISDLNEAKEKLTKLAQLLGYVEL